MSRLKELRKEKGYSQTKMQMLTGIDQRTSCFGAYQNRSLRQHKKYV